MKAGDEVRAIRPIHYLRSAERGSRHGFMVVGGEATRTYCVWSGTFGRIVTVFPNDECPFSVVWAVGTIIGMRPDEYRESSPILPVPADSIEPADRPKKDVLVYLQRDLEAIKHTLDEVLRPYKADVKRLTSENASLRESIARKERDQEKLLRLIATYGTPELLDSAIGVLLDRNRRGWRTFRLRWLQRLGLEPR